MSATPPLGIGLIGVGRHGIRYARHILDDLPHVKLVAACRRSPDRPLDLPGCEHLRVYGDPVQLINDPAVDAVIVVLPPVLNRDIGLAALRARKPVLIEKPLAATHADAAILADAAEAARVPLMTAHTLRFDPVIQALKDCRTRIGRSQHLTLVSHIETKGRGVDHAQGYGGRGALLEFGVHLLDLVRFLTGDEVRDLRCRMHPPPSEGPDTTASIELTTTGGIGCTIEVARVPAGRIGRAEWTGSEGRCVADWIARRLQVTRSGEPGENQLIPPAPTVLAVLTAFLDAVAHRRPPTVSGEDGRRAVEIADACYRSADAGGAVVPLPLGD